MRKRRNYKRDRRRYRVTIDSRFAQIDAEMTGWEMNRLLRQLAKVQRGIFLFENYRNERKGRKARKAYFTKARMEEANLKMKIVIQPQLF